MPKQKKNLKKPSKKLLVEEILDKGDRGEVRALFAFDEETEEQEILLKFKLWSRHFFPDYFKAKDAPFHEEMDKRALDVYQGHKQRFVNIAFRGAAKTSRVSKLFVAFCIANDEEHFRRYFKVLSNDLANAKQITTDVYNMLIQPRVRYYYPEVFERQGDLKREETMGSFTAATGVKVTAGTVGMEQRGDVQEDARPDFILFEDFETRKTLRSAVETKAIWDNMEEARTGLAKGGGAIYNCNYLSERGNVHKLVEKWEEDILVTPLVDENGPTWPEAYTLEDIKAIKKDADDYEGEYLCKPSAGANVFFDRSVLEKMEKRQPLREVAGFKIFYPFDPSHMYGSGHDVAGGVKLDSSTSVFIDFTSFPNKVVATFKSNEIKPEAFGYEIARQAEMYSDPIVAVENNRFDTTIGTLKRIYDNLFVMEMREGDVRVIPKRERNYGWNTNKATKPSMLIELQKAITDGHLVLSDPELIEEVKGYTRDDFMDKDEDPRLVTKHYDLVMALAIAWQMRNFAAPAERYQSRTQADIGLTQADLEIYG